MATQYNASTWTGTYSGNSRNFCGYVIYNWYPNYSATQSLFQIIEIGVRQTSGGSTEWSGGTAIATVSGTGQTSKSASRALSSNKLSWSGAGNKALNSSTTNWYWTRTTSAQTKTITMYGAKSGGNAWTGSKSSSFTLTVPALSSYAVTYYANGGTGAPSSQTKFYNVPLNLSTAIPTRTGYTFTGWNTNASGSGTSYASGSTYTGNSALGLYAVWSANTCTVSYNANGGTGSISAQTKVYDQTLTLSNGAGFTRTNHSITGWNTSADGIGTPYTLSEVLGTTFLTPLTLYAQWHLDYIAPIISNFDAYRVASASSSTETDDGEYIYISFDYQAGTADSGTTWETPTCVIEIDGTTVYNNTLTIDASGQGSFPASTVAYGTYSEDTTHTVEVTIHDTYGVDVTATADINTATYPIDLVGSGIDVYMGIMTPAETGQVLKLHEFKTENMYLDLSDYATSGTTDKEIYDVLVALGWDSDVLVNLNLDVIAWVSRLLSDIYAMQNKSCITACGNGSDISLATSAKVIPMTMYRAKRGTDLTVVSNGVRCEKDGIVAISASAFFTTGYTVNDIVHLAIRINGTNLINWTDRVTHINPYKYYGIPTQYRIVTAGTLIDLCAYNQTGARGLVANNETSELSVAYV